MANKTMKPPNRQMRDCWHSCVRFWTVLWWNKGFYRAYRMVCPVIAMLNVANRYICDTCKSVIIHKLS